MPRLIELQGFPSLYGFQWLLDRGFRSHYEAMPAGWDGQLRALFVVADTLKDLEDRQKEREKVSMRLTIRMGTIAAVCVAALAAIIKL